jgi:hypothetical protein
LGDDLVMAVNRDGFLRLAPWEGAQGGEAPDGGAAPAGTALYRVSDGDFWERYTTASLFVYHDKPAALLYLDDRFLDSDAVSPDPRLWSLSQDFAEPQSWSAMQGFVIPAFEDFPGAEGWDVDTLRIGPDGFWYYRAINRDSPSPELFYLRTGDLDKKGEAVSMGAFQNSALPEPLSAAPALLRAVLNAAFALSGGGAAELVSPDFPQVRRFAGEGSSGAKIAAWYRSSQKNGDHESGSRGAFAAAVLPGGMGFYAGDSTDASEADIEIHSFSLPPLSETFAYTGLGFAGDTLFAPWEEQEDFSIGAAGFMVIRFPGAVQGVPDPD